MTDKKIKKLLFYCKELKKENLVALGDCLSIRDGDGMYVTNPDKEIGEVTESDISRLGFAQVPANRMPALHRQLYLARPDVNAIITNHAPYCVAAAKHLNSMVAVLDDMAQIIGPSIKFAPSYEPKTIVKFIGKSNACIVKNGGVVAVGRTPDEAYTGSMVLEKGAKAYIEGTILGGAVKIPFLEALLMRVIYKNKYSKADQKAKQEELGI